MAVAPLGKNLMLCFEVTTALCIQRNVFFSLWSSPWHTKPLGTWHCNRSRLLLIGLESESLHEYFKEQGVGLFLVPPVFVTPLRSNALSFQAGLMDGGRSCTLRLWPQWFAGAKSRSKEVEERGEKLEKQTIVSHTRPVNPQLPSPIRSHGWDRKRVKKPNERKEQETEVAQKLTKMLEAKICWGFVSSRQNKIKSNQIMRKNVPRVD